MASSSMMRRRRESADERLDRLIDLEMRARAQREMDLQGRPELRRLRVDAGEPPAGSGLERTQGLPVEAPEDPVEQLIPLFEELALEPRGQGAHRLQADQGVADGSRADRALSNVDGTREVGRGQPE